MRQGLGDEHAALHAPESSRMANPSCPTRRDAQHAFEMRGSGACRKDRVKKPLFARRSRTCWPTAPAARGQSSARRAIVGNDVMAVDRHLAEVARTRPQTMPISVVFPAPLGPSRAKISPRPDGEIGAFQRGVTALVDLGQLPDRRTSSDSMAIAGGFFHCGLQHCAFCMKNRVAPWRARPPTWRRRKAFLPEPCVRFMKRRIFP